MKRTLLALPLTLLAGMTLVSQPAVAGPYTDDLSKCLVSNTSNADKTALMTWMFAAIAVNPAVAPMASISADQREKIDAKMARIFERLITEACKDETQTAVKFEGNSVIEASFSVLGQVAGRELFADPEVAKAMGGLDKFIDKEKIEAVLGSAK